MNFSLTDVGKKVSFNIYPAQIMAGSYVGATLLSIGAAASYPKYGPAAMYDNVFSSVPNIPALYTDFLYYEFQLTNGQIVLIGDPWIIPTTVQRSTTGTLTITIYNAGPADVQNVSKLLRAGLYDIAVVVNPT